MKKIFTVIIVSAIFPIIVYIILNANEAFADSSTDYIDLSYQYDLNSPVLQLEKKECGKECGISQVDELTLFYWASKTCDFSPDNTLPFGQKRLTTPWPKVNGERGPIYMSLKEAGNVTLSWAIGNDIENCSQIEYEVKYGSNFTVLDKDDEKRIAHGIINEKAGNKSLVLATNDDGQGDYYIRIAAQKSDGKDIALRSQPVVVHVGMRQAHILPIILPDLSDNFLLIPRKTVGQLLLWNCYDVILNPSGYKSLDCGRINNYNYQIDTTYDREIIFRWQTYLEECESVKLTISDSDDNVVYSDKMTGDDVKWCNTEDGVTSCIERRGDFILSSVVKNLKWGRRYAIWVNALDANGNTLNLPSRVFNLKIDYKSPFIKDVMREGTPLGKGTAKGSPFPKKISRLIVTPRYSTCDPSINGKIYFHFTEPMDTMSVEKSLSVSPPWPDAVISWSDWGYDDKVLSYGNMSNLWFDTTYTFTLGSGAKTKTGQVILETPLQWKIKTYPYAENCPEVIAMSIYPSEISLPSYGCIYWANEKVKLSYWTRYTEYLGINSPGHMAGQFESYEAKLPLGAETYIVHHVRENSAQWGPEPYWDITLENALGWSIGRVYYKINELSCERWKDWLSTQ